MNKTFQVLLVTRGIYPLLAGGIEIHVHYVSEELSKRFRVTTLAEGTGGSNGSGIHRAALLLIGVPPIPFLSSLVFVLKAVFNCACKVRKVDIVHAHQALSPAVAAFLISRIYRIPLIVTCHGSEIRTQKSKLIRLLQRFLFSKANCLTVVSKEMKRILLQDYCIHKPVTVIPNGYDEENVARLRAKKKECSGRIVFVGSLRPLKDPVTLLMGFQGIAGKFPDAELHIIGVGPLQGVLERFCSENHLSSKVFLLGKKSHATTLEFVAESTIFVMTSIEEGLPTALIEAAALGKPIVATSVGGVQEVVKDGSTGLLVPPRSPTCVAGALEQLLASSSLRHELGNAAAENVKDFTWTRIAGKYEEVYQEALARGARNAQHYCGCLQCFCISSTKQERRVF